MVSKQSRAQARAAAATRSAETSDAVDSSRTQIAGKTIDKPVPTPSDLADSLLRMKIHDDSEQPQPVTTADPASGPSRPPFRLDLPAELRLRVYEELLHVRDPLDLDPLNYRRIVPRFNIFYTSRQVFEEAYRVFYSQPINLYPADDRYNRVKYSLLERLPTRYRKEIPTMCMQVGSDWTRQPKHQHTRPELGLAECTSFKLLKVFVRLDPSEEWLRGFLGKNNTVDTYQQHCLDLLQGIFEQAPNLVAVEIDANPGVRKQSLFITALRKKVEEGGKRLLWGPLRGWDKLDPDEPGSIGLEGLMYSLALGPGLGATVQVVA